MKWTFAIACILAALAINTVAHAQTTITLNFTAVGDDSLTGIANKYDLRWSISRPDTTSQISKDAWWVGAVQVTGLPAPLVSGSPQSISTGGFLQGTYYFVLRVKDEVGNWSDWSNVAIKSVTDAIRPAPIRDLR